VLEWSVSLEVVVMVKVLRGETVVTLGHRRWEVEEALYNSVNYGEMLKNGWEPFCIVVESRTGMKMVYFKRVLEG
jgi:hypothetical protein